ncbi:MAG TPA: RNA methyltransferase [Selenomonadales bacterium]|nr:RNA methyltransferase [Selenomonadales bacterium]
MTGPIASPQNQLIKTIASLKYKKHRDELGLFAVEGVRSAEELVASDWQTEVCLFTEAAASQARVRSLLTLLAEKHCRTVPVTDAVFNRITDTEKPQGIMLVARQRRWGLADLLSPSGGASPLLVVLDGIQDPGNVGTVIRTADAAGATGVLLLKNCADPFSGKTVRSTMGSLFHLPIASDVSRDEFLSAIALQPVNLAVTSLEAATPYHQADLAGATAVVFGNEGQGVGPELIAAADCRLIIPLYGRAESLNVAVAAGVVLYEAARQRSAL